MSVMKRLVVTAVLVLASSGVAGVTAADQGLPRVAFFGFQLINTSPQLTTPEETQRIRMLNDMFQQKLDASGRFKMVSIPVELRDKIAGAAEISNCNGCERAFALEAGADWARLGHGTESQQPYIEHQCLYRRRSGKADEICQER